MDILICGVSAYQRIIDAGMYERGFGGFKEPLETHWQAYLDGRVSRDAAIRQILIETVWERGGERVLDALKPSPQPSPSGGGRNKARNKKRFGSLLVQGRGTCAAGQRRTSPASKRSGGSAKSH